MSQRVGSADCLGWPGSERRQPSLGSPTHVVRAPLARWLRGEAIRASRDFGRFRILDVGCGKKPYYPFFEPFVAEYVGLDVDNPLAEVVAPAESIPLPDAGFDVVLCIQFLEHAEDPAAVVRELSRVVAPGGRVLAATHGVSVYHPDPVDHWRWTHTGLQLLFSKNGTWRTVTIEAGAGTASCMAMLVSFYLGVLCRRAHAGRVSTGLTQRINAVAARIDERAGVANRTRPGSLVANYHVTAEAP